MSDGPENLASSFQAVSDACLDGIVTIDVTGSVMAINPAGERLFGACKADLLGRNVSCLMPNPHSERHDSYLQNYARTGSKNVIGRGREVQARRLDTGELFWIHLSVVELAGERRWFTGFARDISETKRHEQQSELNRQKFTGIFESSIDALVCTTSDGTITDVNNTTVQLFGYKDKAELLGLNVSILTPPEHRKYHHLYIENYLKTGLKKVIGTTRELRGCRKDGSLFPIELSLSEVQTELVHGFIGSVRDLTARKEKERVDALLLNMLPSAIALRLSSLPLGGHIADSFDSATILFADIVGFTAMTEMLPPLVVVQYLNRIFSAFDEIAEELHVEKIKTIGDAYMAVTGIPEKTDNNAEVMLRCAQFGFFNHFIYLLFLASDLRFACSVLWKSSTVKRWREASPNLACESESIPEQSLLE